MKAFLKDNKEAFVVEMQRLQRALRGSYSRDQLEVLFRQVKRFKTIHLQKTVNHLLSTRMILPAPHEVVVGCRTESYGDELQENIEERRFARDFYGGKIVSKKEMVKEALSLAVAVLNKKINKDQLQQKMIELDVRFPGKEWKSEAMSLLC